MKQYFIHDDVNKNICKKSDSYCSHILNFHWKIFDNDKHKIRNLLINNFLSNDTLNTADRAIFPKNTSNISRILSCPSNVLHEYETGAKESRFVHPLADEKKTDKTLYSNIAGQISLTDCPMIPGLFRLKCSGFLTGNIGNCRERLPRAGVIGEFLCGGMGEKMMVASLSK